MEPLGRVSKTTRTRLGHRLRREGLNSVEARTRSIFQDSQAPRARDSFIIFPAGLHLRINRSILFFFHRKIDIVVAPLFYFPFLLAACARFITSHAFSVARFTNRPASDHVTRAPLFLPLFCRRETRNGKKTRGKKQKKTRKNAKYCGADLVIDDWSKTLNWPPTSNYRATIAR